MNRQRRVGLMIALMLAGVVATGAVVWVTTPRTPVLAAEPAADQLAGKASTATTAPATNLAAAGAGVAGAPSSATGSPVLAAPTTAQPVTPAVPVRPGCTPAPLAQRAARVLVVGLPGVTDASDPLVRELLDLGVGGVFLNTDNVRSREQVTRLVAGIRSMAGRPIIVSTDEESGRVSVFRQLLGSTPSPRRLAAQETPAAVRQRARKVATQLASMGIDLDLAPVADLDGGASGGVVGDRSFSADPAVAARYAYAYAAGLAEGGVLPVAKHFPGQGRSSEDVDARAASVTVTLDALQSTDLRPFGELIRAGIPAVMVNHIRYSSLDRDLPASLSPRAYQLLRGLGFRGAAITDSVGMGAVNRQWDVAQASVKAVAAGADGVLNTGGRTAKDMRHALVEAVETGQLDASRLDEAASRMIMLAGGNPEPVTCTSVAWPASTELQPPPTTAGSARRGTLLAPLAATTTIPGQR